MIIQRYAIKIQKQKNMFNRRNFNFNIDELIARYDKMMEDFHKTDWSEKSYESPDGSYKITSYYKVFDLNDFDLKDPARYDKEGDPVFESFITRYKEKNKDYIESYNKTILR